MVAATRLFCLSWSDGAMSSCKGRCAANDRPNTTRGSSALGGVVKASNKGGRDQGKARDGPATDGRGAWQMDVGIQMGLDRAHDPLIDKEEKSLCIKTRISKQGDGPLVIQEGSPTARGAGELPETPSSRKMPLVQQQGNPDATPYRCGCMCIPSADDGRGDSNL